MRSRRLDDDAVETPIPAAVRKRFFGGPRVDDDVEGFVEPCVGLFHRHTEPGELVIPVALTDAEIEPAPGEEIEGCRLLRQQHRIVPWQHDDRCSKPQPAGARAEPGQQVERRGDLAIAGKMMLDDKGAVIAERLGFDVVLDEIAKSFAAVEFGAAAPCGGAAEETELHCSSFLPAINSPPRLCRAAICTKCGILITGI